MIKIATPVEDYLFDSPRSGTFGDCLADPPRGLEVSAACSTQLLFGCRSRNYGLAVKVVDNLSVDMVQAAIDCEPWSFGAASNLAANTTVNCFPDYCSTRVCHFFLYELPILDFDLQLIRANIAVPLSQL